ncbi:MAG TPA: DUF6600 domain-containing protein [Arenimonas sp.]|nr:DUF6600 domain-containing protein [Arenimonas sp.]
MFPSRLIQAVAGLLLLTLAAPAIAQRDHYQDPPGRVARVSYAQGDVSYSPAGLPDWLDLQRNRPIIRGDRLWTDRRSRVELQIGSSVLRMDAETAIELMQLDDELALIRLNEGTVNLRVLRLHRGQSFEVATPDMAVVIDRPGTYRIDVDPRQRQTTIIVWQGQADVYGQRSDFPLRAGDTVRFYSDDLRDYRMYGLPRADAFDRFCSDRDQRLARSPSLRYLDDDVLGYADLDEYGSWRRVDRYGDVWFPEQVSRGWAPYRDGHWVWQEPWGWTWIDNAPWGFAPSHYGRWVFISGRWAWIPGPRNVRATYAPALVVFIGGSRWSLALGLGDRSPIGWFPLGPREAYLPPYRSSQNYFTRINVNNTTINNTTINNVYNNYASGNINLAQSEHVNRRVADAITAVPRDVFVNARPVRQAQLALDRRAQDSGELRQRAAIAPSRRSVRGEAADAQSVPVADAFTRPVVARHAPPPAIRPFAERERELQRNPGQPMARPADESRPGRADAPTRNVRVLGEQGGRSNVREVGSRRPDAAPPGSSRERLPVLERRVDPAPPARNEPEPRQNERQRDADVREQQAERQRGVEVRERQAERQQQADARTQEQAERQQQIEARQQEQAERQQQIEARQREVAENQRQADAQQRAQAEREQQLEQRRQMQAQQQAEREREAAAREQAQVEREAAAREQAQAERQRMSEARQQAERQQQAADLQQRQQAEREQRAAAEARAQQEREAQRVERQRERAAAAEDKAPKPEARKPARDGRGKPVADEEDEDDDAAKVRENENRIR